MKTLRKDQKEILEIKNILMKMKNAFDGLSNKLDKADGKKSVKLYKKKIEM